MYYCYTILSMRIIWKAKIFSVYVRIWYLIHVNTRLDWNLIIFVDLFTTFYKPKSYVTSCWMNIDTCLLYCEHWRRKNISSTVDIVWTCVELVDDIKMQDFNSIITPWDVYITIVVSMLYYSAMMPLSKNIIFRNTRKKPLLTAQQQITPKNGAFCVTAELS